VKFSQVIAAALTVLVCLCPPARAQDQYPSRLITIIAPITAGTTIDILARLYADRLSKRFGGIMSRLHEASDSTYDAGGPRADDLVI
jgi:tripartite-type tricarboxylate transporter receptor subunit TctC